MSPFLVVVAAAALLAPIFEHWDRPDSPGAAVAVARDGEIIYADGFGLASLEFEVPIAPETPFHAGSIAKQFTATAILMLEAEGKLSLEDKIRRHVPELPDVADSITLRQLLNHTSGLRDIWALTDLAGWMPGDVRTQDQALRMLSRQRSLNFEPGNGFRYSNSGYLLLAEVVARISGQRFETWMHERLFAPLGMAGTYFYQDPDRVLPNSASSYRSLGRDQGFARDPLNSGLVGGGNLVTTLADLTRWADHLLDAELAGAPLLARLTEQASLPGGLETGYGMGLFVGDYRGLPVVHHGGASAGYRSHLLIFVEENLSIVILGNVNTIRASALANEIADVVLEGRFTASPPGATAEGVDPGLPPEAYIGLYALGPRLLLDVRQSDSRLYFLFGGATPREMFAAGPHTFITTEAGLSLTFTPDANRTVTGVVMEVPGLTLEGQRLQPDELSDKESRAYEGVYRSDELDCTYTIVADNGGLRAERQRGDDFVLRPIDDDRFIEPEAGDLTVRFERTRSGRVRGFELSVERAVGIRFEKR
jgi:CubicO group peptidase (beta-lactamase class C family)